MRWYWLPTFAQLACWMLLGWIDAITGWNIGRIVHDTGAVTFMAFLSLAASVLFGCYKDPRLS